MLGITAIGGSYLLRAIAAEAANKQSTSPTNPTAIPQLPKLQAQAEPVKTPQDLDELRRLEGQCIDVVAKVQPAVVGVMAPSKASLPKTSPHARGASGVIITAEGLVLSQWHVSHLRADFRDGADVHAAGELTTIILSDGREMQAKLLGADATFDLSLLQLMDPGPYPFVPLKADTRLRLGDWVLKLGHPLGFRKDRPAPPRLGRVLGLSQQAFVTDCPIISGDSGGPFFDLEGRLVGIVHLADAEVHNHFAQVDPNRDATDLFNMAIRAPRVASLLTSLEQGKVAPQGRRTFAVELCQAARLPREDWTQAMGERKFLSSLHDDLRTCVVSITNGSQDVALGTVVDAEGLAVTKATHLPPQPQYRLPNGTTKDVAVIGVDKACDVAVIRIPDSGSHSVKWASSDDCQAGRMILAIGVEGTKPPLRVVSVAPRFITAADEFNYQLPLRIRPNVPELFGEGGKGDGLVVRSVWGLAKAAGVHPTDQITSIGGHPLRTQEDVAQSVANSLSGDVVEVELVRDGKQLSIQLPLWPHVDVMEQTFRADGFPRVMEYSPPVRNVECGGPLVDLSGGAIGITIGRTAHHAGWAIPAAEIRRIVNDAKAGRLTRWVSP